MNEESYRKGFTLVELSIVLVIIGLLVSGIMAGRSLIEAGQVRNVVSGMNELEMAIALFVDRYDYLPGDFPNATEYWGSGTRDGDGNHKFGKSDMACCSGSSYNPEGQYGFHHLGLAGMYRSFEQPDTLAKVSTPGLTAPELISGGSAIFQYRAPTNSHDRYNINKPYLQFAKPRPSDGQICDSIITPSIARAVDLKMDDGLASQGRAVSYTQCVASPTNCTDGGLEDYRGAEGSADYLLTNSNPSCRMAFFIFPKAFDNKN